MSTVHFGAITHVDNPPEPSAKTGIRRLLPSKQGYQVGEDAFVVTGWDRLWYGKVFKQLQQARARIGEAFDPYWIALTQTHFIKSLYRDSGTPIPDNLRTELRNADEEARLRYKWDRTPREPDLPEVTARKF